MKNIQVLFALVETTSLLQCVDSLLDDFNLFHLESHHLNKKTHLFYPGKKDFQAQFAVASQDSVLLAAWPAP